MGSKRVAIAQLVEQYGYWMVAGGIFVEGNATVVSAAFLAHQGHLSLGWVCVVALLTTTLENLVLYRTARLRGATLLTGTNGKAQHLARVLEFVRMRGAWILFASRFIVGWRSAVALACGIANMPEQKFFWTNLVGAVVWTACMAAVGYSGGQLMPMLVANVREHEWTIAAVLALGVFCAVLVRGRGRDWMVWWRLFRRLL